MSQPTTAVPEPDRDALDAASEDKRDTSRQPTPAAPTPLDVPTTAASKSADSDVEMDDGAGDADPEPAAPVAELGDDTTVLPPIPTSVPPPAPDVPEEWINLTFKWSGKTYELKLSTSDLIYDLRANIQSLTEVPPAAQKIIGLGRTPIRGDIDANRISTLNLKDGAKFTLVGTPEHLRFKEPEVPPPEEWDLSYSSRQDASVLAPHRDPRNLRRVEQIIKKLPITVMNEPRPGKGLLVLDLDYTIADTRPLLDGALPPLECARPGLHEFLARVYAHYDIVVWSQTRWVWLESKLVELGVLGGDASYKICFVADRSSMFPIFSIRSGQMVKHEVKPLAYFWAKFPHWSAKNTIHIDDLARNFALNPGEGLRIRAFKGAGTAEGLRDSELDRLGHYLVDIATTVDDFRTIDHSQWKKRVKKAQAAQAAQPDAAGTSPPEGPSAGPSGSASGSGDGAGGAP